MDPHANDVSSWAPWKAGSHVLPERGSDTEIFSFVPLGLAVWLSHRSSAADSVLQRQWGEEKPTPQACEICTLSQGPHHSSLSQPSRPLSRLSNGDETTEESEVIDASRSGSGVSAGLRPRPRTASGSRKRQGNILLEAPAGTQPCRHLDFRPARPISSF